MNAASSMNQLLYRSDFIIAERPLTSSLAVRQNGSRIEQAKMVAARVHHVIMDGQKPTSFVYAYIIHHRRTEDDFKLIFSSMQEAQKEQI